MRVHRMGLQYFIPLWLGLSLFTGACNKKVTPAISQPKPASKSEPAPASRIPVPKIWPDLPLPPARIPAPPEPLIAPSFHEAEASFDSGRFKEAILAYDRYLQEDPTTLYRAVAMFKLGMAHALACSAPECRASSVTQFKRLVAQFPKSPYSTQARVILSLQTDIERMRAEGKSQEEKIKSLTDELERLTKIILERQPPPVIKKK